MNRKKKLVTAIIIAAAVLSAIGLTAMRNGSCGGLAEFFATGILNDDNATSAKPVIYLYPERETEVTVRLDVDGELTCTYPAYNNGWTVTAEPDGTLTDRSTGREYSYLFWEAENDADFDMSEGFVVRGEDTAEFLQSTLSQLGLMPREYNEFIVYWLPKMQNNAYNYITFQNEAYTEYAKLDITPKPDSVLRVFMAYRPLDEPIECTEPELGAFERSGFTVVEWGGTELK